MKSKPIKTPVQERAALRAKEERQLDNAFKAYCALAEAHDVSIRDLFVLTASLRSAIKTQHISDSLYKAHRKQTMQVPIDF